MTSTLVLRLWLPLFALWLVASVGVGSIANRLASRGPDTGDRLGVEAWLAFAAAGAATGGFIAVAALLPGGAVGAAATAAAMLGRIVLIAVPGMVLGAVFATVVAASVLGLRRTTPR